MDFQRFWDGSDMLFFGLKSYQTLSIVPHPLLAMAAKSPFIIRGKVEHGTALGFTEDTLDLGAFVDALGKSVLRIHSIQVAHQEDDRPEKGPVAAASGVTLNLGYQLTTQSQTDIIQTSDKSVIASGNTVTSKVSGQAIVQMIADTNNLNPTTFQVGYLIATETLYLGCKTDVIVDDAFTTNVILECSVEKLDERAAMSLALSQS